VAVIKLLADENLRNSIIRGLKRRRAGTDIVRVQDVGLSGSDDTTILVWAAEQGRVLVTYDVNTVPRIAWDRVDKGLPMAGVFAVPERASVGGIIESLVLPAECGQPEDWNGQVLFLPL
jgi:hypothetical protein